MDAHCKIIFSDGIHQPQCKGKGYVSNKFCSHRQCLFAYYEIAAKKEEIKAYGSQQGVQHAPKEIIVGHYGEKSHGVFYVNPESPGTMSKMKTLEHAKFHKFKLI